MTHQVVTLEDGFWGAAGNGDFYRQHMAPEGVCVFSFGVLDREATIASIAEAQPWDHWEMRDLRVVDLGDEAVTLVYRAEAQRSGEPYGAFVASTYVRIGERWLLAVHQQSPAG